MPEFEEPETAPSSKENYTPSTDASKKPRTRRRSGGFQTEYTANDSSMGEVDPAEALKKEKLSGGSKPEPKKENSAPKAKKKRSAPKADKTEPKREKSSPELGNAQPSPETLAAIQRVEARLTARKEERAAKRAEKDKTRPNRAGKKPAGQQRSASRKAPSGGIITSVLSFFGLGPKQAAKKKGGGGKPSGNRGQGSRSPGKGGNRPQGQNRRGGKGRRSGGNGPRRNDRRTQDNKS